MKLSFVSTALLAVLLLLGREAAGFTPSWSTTTRGDHSRRFASTRTTSTSTTQEEPNAAAAAIAASVDDDETALTAAGLLKRDRYIATNRFTVRRNQQAKFEKRWATRKSKLAILDGFKYFQLMRRVKLNENNLVVYDEGDSLDESAFENYVSFTIWAKKSNFNAWRNGQAFVEAHGGTSIAAFLSTMVSSAMVLRGAPRPAFYDGLYVQSRAPTTMAKTVDGWRQVDADGTTTLDAESYMHLVKYYIPMESMKQFESDYEAAVAVQENDTARNAVASALMRRDARAKGHGIKEMTLDEPSYVAIRIFDSKQDWLDFVKDNDKVTWKADDYARKPAQVELYEGTLVISSEQGA